MILGVSCPPAIWIATSSEPNVNTRNDRRQRDDRLVQRPARRPAPVRVSCQPSHASRMRSERRHVANTIAIAMSGTVQSVDLR